jgi:hypothetical protein
LVANEIVPTVPANAHAIALLPVCDAIAYSIDTAGDFVARHPRILQAWPQTVLDKHVAMTNSARFYYYPDFAGPGLRNLALN